MWLLEKGLHQIDNATVNRDDTCRRFGFAFCHFEAKDALNPADVPNLQGANLIQSHAAVHANQRDRLHLFIIPQCCEDLRQFHMSKNLIAYFAAFRLQSMTTPGVILWCVVISVTGQIPDLSQGANVVLNCLGRFLAFQLIQPSSNYGSVDIFLRNIALAKVGQ